MFAIWGFLFKLCEVHLLPKLSFVGVDIMEKALENEIINEMYVSMSPEKREELRKRASELVKDKDFLKAAEIIKHSSSIEMDESKFAGELGWLAALSVAICSVAVL